MRIVVLGLLLAAVEVLAGKERCGPNMPSCPSDKPCCSADGYCGGGAEQCTSGCQPQYSQYPFSCIPDSVCKDMDLAIKPDMYNQDNYFIPLLRYNGDASQTHFVFEQGYLGQGQDGVLFEKTSATDSRVSTARYLLYGTVTARLRHNPTSGLVTTFGTASDVGDAILFRLAGPESGRITTNYAANGQSAQTVGTQKRMNKFNVAHFHNYTIDWSPQNITWKVDNQVIRTVSRKEAGDKFPRTPSRVLFTAYGVSESSNKNVKNWANGTLSFLDEGYRSRGFYSHELGHLRIQCADLKLANISQTGVGSEPVAYVYSNKTNSQTHQLDFSLSTDQVSLLKNPAKDGRPGTPGKPGTGPNGDRPNMYTGGTGRSTTKDSHDDDNTSTVSNGVKIGIPVGIGGAALLGALALLIFYFVRRQKRALRRPPSFVSTREPMQVRDMPASSGLPMAEEPSQHMAVPVSMQPQQEEQPFDLHQSIAVPQEEHAVDLVPEAQGVALANDNMDEAAYYYQDPYGAEMSYEVESDMGSQASDEKAHHMHYAEHGDMRRYYPYLSEEENERIAAQDAWDELREAANGRTDVPYFKSANTSSTNPRRDSDLFLTRHRRGQDSTYRARRVHQRAAYSEGGALSPSTPDTPSFSHTSRFDDFSRL